MKLLWISNAPWMPSGYGSQTRQVGTRIAKAGHDIEFVANDGTRGNSEWNGLLVRGSGYDRYSRDSVRDDLAESGADWVISLYDAWVYTTGTKDPFEGLTRVAGWVPVDHWPPPMTMYDWLGNGHTAIAMSRFGAEWLRTLSDAWSAMIDRGEECPYRPFPVRYAPHAVDDVFTPTESDFRAQIGVPQDAFLIGIVAANTGSLLYDRKGMSDMAAGLGQFLDANPDAYVYVHSVTHGAEMIYLPGLFEFNGMNTRGRLRFADQYRMKKQGYSDADMAAMYSAFDVLLATSRGEGFGIPVIEAQACGTPVIVSNFTAQTELVSDAPWTPDRMGSIRAPSGWLVAIDLDYDATHGANFGKPLIPQIAGALQEAYNARQDSATWAGYKDAALAKAEQYRADKVFEEHWKPILADMASGALETPKVIPINRAARRQIARKAAAR